MAPITAIKMAAGRTAEGAFPKAAIPEFVQCPKLRVRTINSKVGHVS
jgi:hypothetical protein